MATQLGKELLFHALVYKNNRDNGSMQNLQHGLSEQIHAAKQTRLRHALQYVNHTQKLKRKSCTRKCHFQQIQPKAARSTRAKP